MLLLFTSCSCCKSSENVYRGSKSNSRSLVPALQFFITLGTVVFGAFVAVRIFGLDVTGSSMDRPTRRGPRGSSRGEGRRRSPGRRGESPTGVKGLLSGVLGNGDSSTEDEGLLDVWFEPKPGRDSRRAR